ncbi:PREDICTED: cell death regulator Aven-like [Priapulus caudatus]|uniref:Cell death regulator Aven-like n=1 Tax=Priapulus caudatus TaxID=37621 RepID=A0ABM1DTM4_PRICU|nr:PREDICTED: cell death regulator Aven-like [Priapulus caudatus]
MKPDQHKKKSSAQYNAKHNINNNINKRDSGSASSCRRGGRVGRQGRRDDSAQVEPETREQDDTSELEEAPSSFSRRGVTSNWDRYECDVDTPSEQEQCRGADFHSLLTTTGGSAAEFRFKDERQWDAEESESSSSVPVGGFMSIDCDTLAAALACIPLHKRLHLDESLFEEKHIKAFAEDAKRCSEMYSPAPYKPLPFNADDEKHTIASNVIGLLSDGTESTTLNKLGVESVDNESHGTCQITGQHLKDANSAVTEAEQAELDFLLSSTPIPNLRAEASVPVTDSVTMLPVQNTDRKLTSDLQQTSAGTEVGSKSDKDVTEITAALGNVAIQKQEDDLDTLLSLDSQLAHTGSKNECRPVGSGSGAGGVDLDDWLDSVLDS